MELVLTALLFIWPGFILWIANLADRSREAGVKSSANALGAVAYWLTIASYFVFIAIGLVAQAVGAMAGNAAMAESLSASGFPAESFSAIGLSLWAPSLLGLLLLWRPVRAFVGRFTALSVDRTVHAVALSFVALVFINLFFTLGMGLDNLAATMESSAAAGVTFNPIGLVWTQDIMMVLLGLVGVGWLARRGIRPARERLGIVMPTWRQALIGLGAGLVMVPVIILLESLLARIGLGPNADVERITEQMIGPLTQSAFGILTLGLAAALGEETVFRGAMQPRFGLLLTSLLFALLHSTYGLSVSTLLVFIVGMVLGLLRLRFNTSTSMITHAVYNMTLGVIAYLGLLENL